MINLRRTLAIAVCEARLLRRDPLLFVRAVGVPVALLFTLGYGLSLDVEHIPFAVVDYDQSATSREYLYAFAGIRAFDLRTASATEAEVETMLRRGAIRLAIIIPSDFERTLYRGLPSRVQLLVDGVYPYRAEVTRGYALRVHADVAAKIWAARVRERTGTRLDFEPIEVRTRYLYNEDLRTTNTILPGLLTMILMTSPAIMAAVAIAREKELGSIFNFLSSPASQWEFVLGKLTPYAVIALGNALVLGAIVTGVFRVPFKGSLPLYVAGSLLYVVATTALGLVISSFVRSQIAAVVVTIVLTVIPSIQYSGLLIPVSNLKIEGRFVAHLLPGMYHNRIVLSSFLKNLPFHTLLPELGVLLLFIAVLLAAAVACIRKREP